jgi:hypothetical protein
MAESVQQTLFALDCGATNWRLYRLEYQHTGGRLSLLGEPQPAPLTSFNERKLPAILCLNPEGDALECFGEVAQGQLEHEQVRARVREYFKPCIGVHLEDNPLPHQKRYTHAQAMDYTRLLLQAVLEQLRGEKWRGMAFDDRLWFTFAYPIHWRYEHKGKIFEQFQALVRGCFDEGFERVRFVAEPEGAILSLSRHGQLASAGPRRLTLIIDVGGSTTDIVAGEADPNTGRLGYLGRYGQPFGGGLYDAELANYIADEMQIPASVIADDPSAMVSLRMAGQRLKESLSRQLSSSGELNHIPKRAVTLVSYDGTVYRRTIQLDATRFNEITGHLDADFENLIDHALKDIALQLDDIGQVVLVGGGSQLFTIMDHLRGRFGQERILLADNPDEVVVQGIGLEYLASFEPREPTIVFPAAPQVEETDDTSTPSAKTWILVDAEERQVPLQRGITRLGRGEKNEIQVDDLKASRLHAELSLSDDKLEIIDLGSTNGTYLNSEKLPAYQPSEIQAGDRFSIGDVNFNVRLE